ncbi:hypothetical protein [Larkinella soli]|uniref:hypothetical protein n=1 Tax=Larkinella soli TaxID=1770527 RepID=UPI000FFB745A|nr:hypothetical protein [Larkinella soli]
MTPKSAIVRLIGQLPADIAEQKRKAIELDLMELGEWEHYRQSVRRPGYNLKNTHVACAQVLKKHLGLTDEFFTCEDGEREQMIAEVLKRFYENHLV